MLTVLKRENEMTVMFDEDVIYGIPRFIARLTEFYKMVMDLSSSRSNRLHTAVQERDQCSTDRSIDRLNFPDHLTNLSLGCRGLKTEPKRKT